ARMRGEARAAKAGLVERVALHHRAHRAVEDQDATGKELTQAGFGGHPMRNTRGRGGKGKRSSISGDDRAHGVIAAPRPVRALTIGTCPLPNPESPPR